MASSAGAVLSEIKRELNSIINELDSIADGVRRDFVGIGTEECANCLSRVADKYRWVRRQLNNIDLSDAMAEGGNGGGGGGGRSF